jgi:peptide/nickel transport system permease protein
MAADTRVAVPGSGLGAEPRVQVYRGQWRQTWRRFRRHKLAALGLAVLTLIILASLVGPLLSPHDPEESDLLNQTQAPSLSHLMGTDELGRDLLTRILYGGRVSLAIGVLAMLVSMVIGVAVGALAGFYGGVLDNALMRLVDMLVALPRLFVLILISAISDGTSFLGLVLILGAFAWTNTARLVRERYLVIREREYVEAARAIGASNRSVILRHILPNAFSPVIVAATLGVAGAIITESSLSFLGLGISPAAMPTWGNILQFAQSHLRTAPWIAIFPGMMIFITVISVNFVGDGLRDALDPYKT